MTQFVLIVIIMLSSLLAHGQIRLGSKTIGLAEIKSILYEPGKIGLNPALMSKDSGLNLQINNPLNLTSALFKDISWAAQ